MFVLSTVLSHTMPNRGDIQPYSQLTDSLILLTAPQIFFIRIGRPIAPVHSPLSECYCRTSIATLLHSQPSSGNRKPCMCMMIVDADHVRFEHRPESQQDQPTRYSALFTTYLLSGLIDSTAGFPHALSPYGSSGCSCAQPAPRFAQRVLVSNQYERRCR